MKNTQETISAGVNGRECFIIIILYLLHVRIVSHAKVFWNIYLPVLRDTIYAVYPIHLKIRKNTIFLKVNECLTSLKITDFTWNFQTTEFSNKIPVDLGWIICCIAHPTRATFSFFLWSLLGYYIIMLSLHQWHRPPLHSIYKAYIYSIECTELQEAGKGRQLGAAHQIQQRFPPPKIQKYKTCYFFSTYHISWDTTGRNYVCYHEQFNILNFQNINNLR